MTTDTNKMMILKSSTIEPRASALDALRGYAILTMVLSGTLAFGILPGWMYHTLVPHPAHQFDPTIVKS